MSQTDVEKSFNRPDETKDAFMLKGSLANAGIDLWWHSFFGKNKKTGERRGFYIQFFGTDPALSNDKVILLGRDSYFLVKAGAWGDDGAQLNRFFMWNDVNINEEQPLHISAGECFLSESRTMGRVSVTEDMTRDDPERYPEAGDIVWDLKIEKEIAFNVGYPSGWASRELEALENFWHGQGMKTRYDGMIKFNGEEYEVTPEESFGYADKMWGRDFADPWLLLESNHLRSRISGEELTNSAYASVGAAPKIGPISLDEKLVSAIWYEGEPFEYNFSKLWTMTRTTLKFREKSDVYRWTLTQETPMSKLKLQITVEKSGIHELTYNGTDETGESEKRVLRCSKSGIGRMKVFRKKLSGKKWVWETVDDIDILDVGCIYGGTIPNHTEEAVTELEGLELKREMRRMKREQKRQIKILRSTQKMELKALKKKRKATEKGLRGYKEISPDSDKSRGGS